MNTLGLILVVAITYCLTYVHGKSVHRLSDNARNINQKFSSSKLGKLIHKRSYDMCDASDVYGDFCPIIQRYEYDSNMEAFCSDNFYHRMCCIFCASASPSVEVW